MGKTYQKEVITLGEKMIKSLTESGFFAETEITNIEDSHEVVFDFLTEKFIDGKIIDGVLVGTDEDDMRNLFSKIMATCILNSLKRKGILNSVDDNDGEEIYFLTDEGKKMGEKMKKDWDMDSNKTRKDTTKR